MTIPIREPAEYELYRVILDYEALQDGFLDRIEDLDTTLEQIEMNGEMARGNAQKLLTKNPGKAISRKRDHRTMSARRTFGWESLGKMLKGTGLALVLVVDDARFADMKEQLAKRKRPRLADDARPKKPRWLFSSNRARKARQKWWNSLTPEQQKRHQRKAQKGQAAARRRKRLEQEKRSAAPAALRTLETGRVGLVGHASAAPVSAVKALDCAK